MNPGLSTSPIRSIHLLRARVYLVDPFASFAHSFALPTPCLLLFPARALQSNLLYDTRPHTHVPCPRRRFSCKLTGARSTSASSPAPNSRGPPPLLLLLPCLRPRFLPRRRHAYSPFPLRTVHRDAPLGRPRAGLPSDLAPIAGAQPPPSARSPSDRRPQRVERLCKHCI
ncbi:hypothetical protein FKP32DRAFT_1754304, partial [Trametes sanguinea]